MDQASDVTQWLVGQGGVRNFSALVASAPCTALAAAIDLNAAGMITVFPATLDAPSAAEDPTSDWQQGPGGTYRHAFDGFPNTDTADHMVLVGVTVRNEVLLLNLAALRGSTVGIEANDPIDLARSWILQILSRTPEAKVSTTVADTLVPGSARITDTPDDDTTVAFLGDQTTASQPDRVPGRITIDCRRDAEPTDSMICDAGAQTGVLTIGTWVFPIWRRIEVSAEVWDTFRAKARAAAPATAQPAAPAAPDPADVPATEKAPQQTTDVETPRSLPSAEDTAVMPVPELEKPAVDLPWRTDDEPTPPATAPAASSGTATPTAPAPAAPPAARIPEPPLVTPTPVTIPTPSAPTTDLAPSISAARTPVAGPKISVLGPIVVEAPDGTEHTAIVRGREKLITRAILIVATGPDTGTPTAEWIKNTWDETPNNQDKVRAMRTQIRRALGADAIDFGTKMTVPSEGLIANSDWRQFLELVGDDPTSASTEDLELAVGKLRGQPFEDAPPKWNWKTLEILKDQLIDAAADAALELATRKKNTDDLSGAFDAARAGTRANPNRSDLWEIALETAPAEEQSDVLYDAERVPDPSPELRELIKFVRTESPAR